VEGLYFPYENQESPGAHITVCQEETGPSFVPEDLHDFLVLFLVRTLTDGSTTTELLPTMPGAADCEGFEGFATHSHVAFQADGQRGILSRLAAGISRVSEFFLPKPLFAKRRLHGGLNTVVWEISGDDGEMGDGGFNAPSNIAGLEAVGPEPELLQFGSVLNVDIDATTTEVVVPSPGFVGEPSTIAVKVLDKEGQVFLFPVDVTVDVTGANDTTVVATYDPVDSTYYAVYIPKADGNDQISITLEKEPYLLPATLGPFYSEIRLVKGPLTAEVWVYDPAANNFAAGYPVELYDPSSGQRLQIGTTDFHREEADGEVVGRVTFDNVTYGRDYVVHLAKRDFDVAFTAPAPDPGKPLETEYTRQIIGFSKNDGPVVFAGATLPNWPAQVKVFRLGYYPDGIVGDRTRGTGHAYEYVQEGRSWIAANNQIRDISFYGEPSHLASVYNLDENGSKDVALNPAENDFIARFLKDACEDQGAKQCRTRAWLGLSDEVEETQFVWSDTGELANGFYTNWAPRNAPSEQKDNTDHVEISPWDADPATSGLWYVVNGASSTNDGYIVETDTPRIQPPSLPSQPGGGQP
jgi:hypothetical protein